MKETIKLLIFDIDGTLVDRTKSTVEKSALNAINKARENGYRIMVATGRNFPFIVDDVKYRLKPEFYITTNGACINDEDGNLLEEQAFTDDEINAIIDFTQENNYPLGVKFNDCIATYHNHDEFIDLYVGAIKDRNNFIKDDSSREIINSNNAHGCYYFGPYESEQQLAALIPTINITKAENVALELFPKHANKAKSIEKVLHKLNYTWENVMSFGDGYNDIEMLEHSNIAVVMNNADQAVKEYADFITDDVLDDGIEKALKHYHII